MDEVLDWTSQLLAGTYDARKRNSISKAVAGAIGAQSTVCSHIARSVPGEAYDKHKIKRFDRLLANDEFEPKSLFPVLLQAFNFRPGQRVLLALDWTTVGRFEVLVTSVVTDGRALPFQWTIIDQNKVRKANAQLEHVRELQAILPEHVRFIHLFDAGFDDGAFVKEVVAITGLKFVIRSSPTFCFKPNAKRKRWRNMKSFRFKRGVRYDLGEGAYTKTNAIELRCVGLHDHKQQKPWILLTNLKDDVSDVVLYYSRRFTTEEAFKDVKDVRSGMQLKGSLVRSAARLSRLTAIVVLAYWLMTLAGMEGERIGHQRRMQANTRQKRVLAVWRVGRDLILKGLLKTCNLLELLWDLMATLSNARGGCLCTT